MSLTIDLLKAPHVGIRDLKEHLSEFLRKEKPVVVTDHGEPINVIVSYEEMIELLDIIDEMEDDVPHRPGKLYKLKTDLKNNKLLKSSVKKAKV